MSAAKDDILRMGKDGISDADLDRMDLHARKMVVIGGVLGGAENYAETALLIREVRRLRKALTDQVARWKALPPECDEKAGLAVRAAKEALESNP